MSPFKAWDISCSKKPDRVHTLNLILPSKYFYLSYCPGLSLIGKSFFCPSHITEINPKLQHRTTINEAINPSHSKVKAAWFNTVPVVLMWVHAEEKHLPP